MLAKQRLLIGCLWLAAMPIVGCALILMLQQPTVFVAVAISCALGAAILPASIAERVLIAIGYLVLVTPLLFVAPLTFACMAFGACP